MRKLLCCCLSLFFLNSCASWSSKCSTFSAIEVKHVYDDGVIATACADSAWTKSPLFCRDQQDIFLKKNGDLYYDGQNVEIPSGMCAIVSGSKTKNGKTYPFVEITNPNTYDLIGSSQNENTPSKTLRNEKCEDIPAIKIFQVLDNFALAHVCRPDDTPYDYCFGHSVYVSKGKNDLFFDDKVVQPKDGQCFTYGGTYKYESKNGVQHTVPKVKFVDAETPNPEYQKWLNEQKKKSE